jgi:hypothetical protein
MLGLGATARDDKSLAKQLFGGHIPTKSAIFALYLRQKQSLLQETRKRLL